MMGPSVPPLRVRREMGVRAGGTGSRASLARQLGWRVPGGEPTSGTAAPRPGRPAGREDACGAGRGRRVAEPRWGTVRDGPADRSVALALGIGWTARARQARQLRVVAEAAACGRHRLFATTEGRTAARGNAKPPPVA
jgi:hypothetical protein